MHGPTGPQVPGSTPHHVVIVGGGFGGLYAARELGRDKRVELTLVDRRNFHLFQPLLYQVATGALAPGEIAKPLRAILRRKTQHAGRARPGHRTSIRRRARVILSDGGRIGYDSLIVATGARFSYFGNDEWAPLRAGPQDDRRRDRDPAPDLHRLRGGRARGQPRPTGRVDDIRHRRRRPDRASSWPARWARSRTTRCAATSARSTRPTRGSSSSRRWSACCCLPAGPIGVGAAAAREARRHRHDRRQGRRHRRTRRRHRGGRQPHRGRRRGPCCGRPVCWPRIRPARGRATGAETDRAGG